MTKFRKRKPLFDLICELSFRVSPIHFNENQNEVVLTDEVRLKMNFAFSALEDLRVAMIKAGLDDQAFCAKSQTLSALLDTLEAVVPRT